MEWLIPYDLTDQTPGPPGGGPDDVLQEWLDALLTAWKNAGVAGHPDTKRTIPLLA